MLKALFYAYILGGITFIPLLLAGFVFITLYTSVPVGDIDAAKANRKKLETGSAELEAETLADVKEYSPSIETNDIPRTRKGWLTMRRTYEESISDGSYVTYVRSFLDARSKDPKKSRPKDMWYVVLKGNVLFLYEDEDMTECEAAVELSGHQIIIYPEGLLDGELFAKRNAICLRPKLQSQDDAMPSVTKTMKLAEDGDTKQEVGEGKLDEERGRLEQTAREVALNPSTPWFIFVRSNVEMEDWYFALLHASNHSGKTPTLAPLHSVFQPADMNHLVATLDGQPDVIPMRWLNALIGRIFFSYYRTQHLESYIIGRLMKKLSKVKRPAILTDIVVKEVNVGDKAPMLSKPMLKELTKEGDASLEVHFQYKGEVRITVEATATINLGARFKSYTVKLVLAAVVKELEGNLLIKVKRPPSNRIWYAFTQTPRMVIEVEPIVSDRQITWSMILSTIESKFKEIIQESVVMPNMDDIAFFESSPYEHRGGIWADASRHQRAAPGPSDITEDNRSVASAPPDISIGAPTPTLSEPILEQSQLAEGLPHHNRSSSQPDIPLVQPPSASSTEEAPDLSRTFSRNSTRRRSWFTGVLSEEVSASTVPEFKVEEVSHATTSNLDNLRGRALSNDKSSSSTCSHAQSNKAGSDISSDADVSEQDFLDVKEDKASVHSSRRSASQHSASRDPESSTAIATNKSAPSTPKKSLDSARSTSSTRSPSPPGFFSTLKSRAADKQAISNTAKEAMRKWGVNWGGLKKDVPSANDDTSDGGSHQRTDSEHKRASYAEVRAAVAERKEREKNVSDDGASRGSSPPPVPSKGPSRVVSNPLALLPSGLSAVDGFNALKSTVAPTLSTKKSTSSFNRTGGNTEDTPVGDEAPKHKPIQLQPQGKTMTIPGIHASHRGDVMSMGYVAPQSTSPSLLDTKLKNPAIQSVYRLWKNPSTSDPDQTLQPELYESTAGDMDESVPPLLSPFVLENQVTSQPLAKQTPPPLPPRSIPTGDARPVIATTASDVLAPSTIAAKNENVRTTQTTLPNLHFTDGDREDGPSDINNTVLSMVDQQHADEPVKHMPPPLPPRKISAPV